MKQWFSSHFQRLFIIFKLLFYSSYTYSSDSSVSYCIHFYLLLLSHEVLQMQMRFYLRGFAERRRIVVIVNNSRWCRSDSEQTHKFLPLDCDTRGRNLCVCAEPRWRKELKCQSLKTKPREVRALNLLRTFSEREWTVMKRKSSPLKALFIQWGY